MKGNPLELSGMRKSANEQISEGSPLSAIPVIENSVVNVRTREDLNELVETPLLEACQLLYDLNIKTLMSSANGKDIGRSAYIDIDFDSLSEENKEIALTFGPIGMMHGSKPTPCVQVAFPVTESTTIEDIRKAALEAVAKFKRQDLTWGRYTREELAEIYRVSPEEISPEEWSDEFPYDAESKYYYLSMELLEKGKGAK